MFMWIEWIKPHYPFYKQAVFPLWAASSFFGKWIYEYSRNNKLVLPAKKNRGGSFTC